jgi:CIC family chloride channel protein
LQHEPIYESLAVQDGIHLPSSVARQRQDLHQVERVMRPASESLPCDITVGQALEQVRGSTLRNWLVTDERGLIGVVRLSTLEQEAVEHSGNQLGELLGGQAFPHVHSDQGLDLALARLGANQLEILPVVSRADVHQLLGVVTLRDVLNSYGVGAEGRGDASMGGADASTAKLAKEYAKDAKRHSLHREQDIGG